MMVLVSGGSKCGKSGYAESLFSDFNGEKVYLATMQPFGNEAMAAIERHRRARLGLGFSTVERFVDIEGADIPSGSGVLLEDLGNLLANEMFSGAVKCGYTEKILCGIDKIRRAAALFVIVTNDVFADGLTYPDETELYINKLSELNCAIANRADRVAECVYGIPIVRKERL